MRETLMEAARRGGICVDGYELMRVYGRDKLIGLYIENPDWCIERRFPSLELLRREFSDIEDKGVYVGRTFDGEVFDKLQTYVFHDCKGTIRVAMDYDNAVIPMLYFANGCDIRVECEQKNGRAIVVPLYIAEAGSGLKPGAETKASRVVGAKSANCVFRRYSIKPVER